ncbi:hypothetical protein [Geosporobacter ferrireducens]|uniref:Uncharacterized protein n=1 Tax=Geosporobacter ferrireducens TaxID=1424294 RepID=A0A1D8GG94_9FIRM|nr:hypothetical protein [Geosporobacter ferrireducens]AOT69915.1 hypothetical protein Gferi_10170 [Geosporobacter ferrireducens]
MTIQKESKQIPKKVAIIIISLSVVWAVLILGGITYFVSKSYKSPEVRQNSKVAQNQEIRLATINAGDNEYREKLTNVLGDMEYAIMKLTIQSDYIVQIWHNAIFSNKNVEESLKKALKNSDEIDKNTSEDRATTRERIKTLMQELSNPPEELREVHKLAIEMYSHYLDLYGLTVNPSGIYETYVNNVNEAKSKFYKNAEKLLVVDPSFGIKKEKEHND